MTARDEAPRDRAARAELDPALRDAADALRAVPAAGADALARATAAALAAQRDAFGAGPAGRGPAGRGWAPRARPAAWAAWAAGVVAAVGLGVGTWRAGDGAPAVAAGPAPAAPTAGTAAPVPAAPAGPAAGALQPAAAGALDELPRPVRFALRAPGAGRVALVGDFNRWDPAATPLAPAAGGGPVGEWEVEVPLTPGRHAYAFVVDGGGWVLDPAAPSERDPDFDRRHSVTVVGLERAR